MKKYNFVELTSPFLNHFSVLLLIVITCRSILVLFLGFAQNQEIQDSGSKMASVSEYHAILMRYDVISPYVDLRETFLDLRSGL